MDLLLFVCMALLLLAFGLSETVLGPRAVGLNALLALCAMAPVFWVLARRSAWHGARLALPVVAAVSIVVWYTAADATRWFALTVALGSLTIALPDHRTRQLGTSLAWGAFALAIFVVVRDHATLWPLWSGWSHRWTSAVSTGLGRPMSLGPSWSGATLVAAVSILMLAHALVRRQAAVRILVPVVLLLGAVPVVVLLLRGMAPAHVHDFEPRLVFGWRIVAYLLVLVPLALFTAGHPLAAQQRAPTLAKRRGIAWAAVGVLLVGLAMTTWSSRVPGTSGRVLLDTRGAFDMQLPGWGQYGPDAPGGASLATLPLLLEAYGFTFTTSDTLLDAARLSETDVLITMNPKLEYTPDEHAAIWDFVARGGGLLVLGDHTNIMESMGPLNALLEPTGVRVAFDSAIPLVERWTWYGCMRMHPHPLTRNVRDEADVKISVGASLELPAHALPLFTGREAFADAGDWENRMGAYLGNMAYDVREPLGDLFLAAEVPHGQGKVIVYGDTSPFQRVAVFNTHELVTSTMSYLASRGHAVAPRWVRVTGSVLLTLAALLLLAMFPGLLAIPLTAGVLASAWLVFVDSRAIASLPQAPHGDTVAWVDLGHGNRVDLHAGEDIGIYGLTSHLWRQGFLPLAVKDLSRVHLPDAAVFVTVAPAIPFDSDEIEALRQWVEAGGLLLVASGYEESNGVQDLLDAFDYAIGRTPMGAAHAVRSLLEGENVLMHEAWPVRHPDGRGTVWAESWGYPLIVFERIGDGGLLVVGDSGFLTDGNLESPDFFVEPNILFLRRALDTARGLETGEGR